MSLQKKKEKNNIEFGQPTQESNLRIYTVIGDSGGTEKTVPKAPKERTPSFPLVQLYYTTHLIKVNNFIIHFSRNSKDSQNVVTIAL